MLEISYLSTNLCCCCSHSLRLAKLGQLTPELMQTVNPHTNILFGATSMVSDRHYLHYYLLFEFGVVQFHSLSYSLLIIGVVLLLAHVPLSSVRVNVASFGGAMLNHGGSLPVYTTI